MRSSMSDAQLRAGLSIGLWWFAMRQTVLITNLIILETLLEGNETKHLAKRRILIATYLYLSGAWRS